MSTSPKPLFEGIKCLTRKYIITTIITLAVLINVLFYIVEYLLQKQGYTHDFLGYQLVLIVITIFVVLFVMIVFLTSLDGLRDKMVVNLKSLIGIIRNQTEQDRGKKIVIDNLSCNDEVYEIVEVLNQKTEQIDQYVKHLHYVIGYIQHEFNTPLATLSLGLDRLKKQHPEIKIESLQEDIEELSSIMNSLASLSGSQEIEVEKKELELGYHVQKVISDLRPLYDTNQFVVTGEKSMIVRTQELYLHLILRNLIENACKYSKRGSKIEIVLENKSLIIRDSGVGMSKESLDNMWKPFRQIDKSRGADKGFGLGLTLVKRLTELLGIKVVVTSELHNGTEFVLHFSDE